MTVVMFILIACICYFFYAHDRIDRLERENSKLKKQVAELKKALGITPQSTKSWTTNLRSTNTSKSQVHEEKILAEEKILTEEEKNAIRLQREKKERESRNTGILVTGAVLIILAAIVFLMSTWSILGNVGKLIILSLVAGVFFYASKLAKEKYNLEKASNTFFYIAMAYIPLGLLGCSIFGLFGEFLSIFGEGKFIYLTVSMALTSVIYYLAYNIRKSKGMLYGSILAQALTSVLCSLIFETNILLISLALLIYNILLIMLTMKNKDEYIYFYNGLLIAGIIFGICGISSESFLYSVAIILTAINTYMLYKLSEEPFYAYFFNGLVYYAGFNIMHMFTNEMSLDVEIIFDTLFILGTWIIENVLLLSEEKKDLKVGNSVISLIAITMILMKVTSSAAFDFVKPYMVALVELGMMIGDYINSKETGKSILGFLIPILIVFAEYNCIYIHDGVYYLYPLCAIITFALSEMLPRNDNYKMLNIGCFIIFNIYLAFTYIGVSLEVEKFRTNVIMYLILDIAYIYMYLKNTNYIIFKYLAYIVEGILLNAIVTILEVPNNVSLLIPGILTAEIMFFEKKIAKLHDELSNIFICICQVVSLIAFSLIDDFNIKLVFLAGGAAGLTGLSIYNKKIDLNTITSSLYLIATVMCIENVYAKFALVMIWAVIYIIGFEDEKVKDFFKIVLYVTTFFLYQRVIFDLELDSYTAFKFLGIISCAVVILRTVLCKYIKELDSIEYLVFGLIYFSALFSYIDEIDGMLFGALIVAMMVISYVKRYGAIFIASLAAIIVNALILTRVFWILIPWWIYLLVIGGVLISFGIKNESDEKRGLNVKGVIQNIKDKVEKQ